MLITYTNWAEDMTGERNTSEIQCLPAKSAGQDDVCLKWCLARQFCAKNQDHSTDANIDYRKIFYESGLHCALGHSDFWPEEII